MLSQKEMAQKLKKDIEQVQKERVEVGVIQEAKKELTKEQQIANSIIQEAIAEKGYIISVPGTEVVLYEDEGYQLLYCNHVERPSKFVFLMAMKVGARSVTGRTAITSEGYIVTPMPKSQFNLILASHRQAQKTIETYKEQTNELRKELAPLRYINHLINKHKLDTK